jgi:hypothetical protein
MCRSKNFNFMRHFGTKIKVVHPRTPAQKKPTILLSLKNVLLRMRGAAANILKSA